MLALPVPQPRLLAARVPHSLVMAVALHPLEREVLPILNDLLWRLALLDDAPPGSQQEQVRQWMRILLIVAATN
jgi:hypothetical protein